MILVFEDLQWADSGLLEFIDYLLEWSADRPLFVLACARPELLRAPAGCGARDVAAAAGRGRHAPRRSTGSFPGCPRSCVARS